MAVKSPNFFSVIDTLVRSAFSKLDSKVGRINVLSGFITLLIALAFVLAPVAHYVLIGVQSICNTVLILNDKEPMPVDTSAPSIGQIAVWLIIIFVESMICAVAVYLSEQLKINLSAGTPTTKGKRS